MEKIQISAHIVGISLKGFSIEIPSDGKEFLSYLQTGKINGKFGDLDQIRKDWIAGMKIRLQQKDIRAPAIKLALQGLQEKEKDIEIDKEIGRQLEKRIEKK